MATVMELLRELPDRVFDELRAMVEHLGPHATPAEMVAAAGRLSPATREDILALLVAHLREEVGAPPEGPPTDQRVDPGAGSSGT